MKLPLAVPVLVQWDGLGYRSDVGVIGRARLWSGIAGGRPVIGLVVVRKWVVVV